MKNKISSKNWKIKKLREIGKISNGNSINEQVKKKKYLYVNDGLPYIATKDISYNHEIDYNNGIKIPRSEIDNFKISHKNSTLICAEGGSAGRKMAFNTEDVCFVNKLFSFEPSELVEPKFIYYFYQSDAFQKKFKSLITGLIGGVSMNKFREIEIPLPPISEQKRIVEILDKSFENLNKAKENAEHNLKNAKEIFDSYLENVFENRDEGWEERNLGDLAKVTKLAGYEFTKFFNSYKDGGDIIVIRGKNITKNVLDLSDVKKISKKTSELLPRSQLKKGDLVFAYVGTIGPVFVIPESNKYHLGPNTSLIRFKENILPEYAFYYFNSQLVKREISKFVSVATQPNLSMEKIRKFNFVLPSNIEDQKRIVKKLDSLSAETKKLEDIYQQKLEDLEELKKSILQKAFNGELVN